MVAQGTIPCEGSPSRRKGGEVTPRAEVGYVSSSSHVGALDSGLFPETEQWSNHTPLNLCNPQSCVALGLFGVAIVPLNFCDYEFFITSRKWSTTLSGVLKHS